MVKDHLTGYGLHGYTDSFSFFDFFLAQTATTSFKNLVRVAHKTLPTKLLQSLLDLVYTISTNQRTERALPNSNSGKSCLISTLL